MWREHLLINICEMINLYTSISLWYVYRVVTMECGIVSISQAMYRPCLQSAFTVRSDKCVSWQDKYRYCIGLIIFYWLLCMTTPHKFVEGRVCTLAPFLLFMHEIKAHRWNVKQIPTNFKTGILCKVFETVFPALFWRIFNNQMSDAVVKKQSLPRMLEYRVRSRQSGSVLPSMERNLSRYWFVAGILD